MDQEPGLDMHIALLTALTPGCPERRRVEEIVLRYYAKQRFAARVAIVSEDYAGVEGWTYVYAANEPLGKKWNAGLSFIRDVAPDAVMIVGSDDLITEDWVRQARLYLKKGYDHLYGRDFHFYDTQTGTLTYMAQCLPGAGRFVSARALEQLNWAPWPDGSMRYLDSGFNARIARLTGLKTVKMRNVIGLDIKTRTNLWQVDERGLAGSHGGHIAVRQMHHVDDPAAWLRMHFGSVADELLSLGLERAA